jgi:hypothetical protein
MKRVKKNNQKRGSSNGIGIGKISLAVIRKIKRHGIGMGKTPKSTKNRKKGIKKQKK